MMPAAAFRPPRSAAAGAGHPRRLFRDVDGVLTDGGIALSERWRDQQTLQHARTAMASKLLQKAGITPAVVTGRDSPGPAACGCKPWASRRPVSALKTNAQRREKSLQRHWDLGWEPGGRHGRRLAGPAHDVAGAAFACGASRMRMWRSVGTARTTVTQVLPAGFGAVPRRSAMC